MAEELPDEFRKNLETLNGQTVYVDCHKSGDKYMAHLSCLEDIKEFLDAFNRKLLASTMTREEFLYNCYRDLNCVCYGKTAEEAKYNALQAFKNRQKLEIKGDLDPYFETGTEGIIWIVYEDGKKGYDGLHALHPLDQLTIYGEKGEILFNEKIFPDWKAGWAEYPRNPGHGQPAALGCWIHWTQIGWEPDKWASFFLRKKGESVLKAKLVCMRQKIDKEVN